MERSSCMDAWSIRIAISSCAKNRDWQKGQELIKQMQKWALEADLFCHTALLSSYQRSTAWELGLRYLKLDIEEDVLKRFDSIGFESALNLTAAGAWQEAFWLFSLMQEQAIQPSITGLVTSVKALQNSSTPPTQCQKGSLQKDLYDQIEHSCVSLLLDIRPSVEQLLTDGPDGSEGSKINSKTLRQRIVHIVSAVEHLLSVRIEGVSESCAREGVALGEEQARSRSDESEAKELKSFHTMLEKSLGRKEEFLEQGKDWEKSFHTIIFWPVLEALRSSNVRLLGHIHTLGGHFTQKALNELRMTQMESAESSNPWALDARKAVAAALQDVDVVEPSARHLMSWVSYSVRIQVPNMRPHLLRTRGFVVPHGPHDRLSDELPSVFCHFDRSQHSERRALLKVLERLSSATQVAQAEAQAQAEAVVTGSVRLFSCHTPCVSCLFVFTQFQQLFPQIRLQVAFQSWAETRADALQNCTDWRAKTCCAHRWLPMFCFCLTGVVD